MVPEITKKNHKLVIIFVQKSRWNLGVHRREKCRIHFWVFVNHYNLQLNVGKLLVNYTRVNNFKRFFFYNFQLVQLQNYIIVIFSYHRQITAVTNKPYVYVFPLYDGVVTTSTWRKFAHHVRVTVPRWRGFWGQIPYKFDAKTNVPCVCVCFLGQRWREEFRRDATYNLFTRTQLIVLCAPSCRRIWHIYVPL